VRRVGEKLGFDEDGSFKFEDVVLIYDICRFEKAGFKGSSINGVQVLRGKGVNDFVTTVQRPQE
jgi:hypothetical protein